jgi:hypothetical protein
MKLKDKANQYKEFAKAFAASRSKEGLLIAMDATALMIDRIQSKGTGSDGKKFKLYSDNEIPTFFFEYKNAPTKVESFKKKVAKGKAKSSYKAFRSHLGLPIDKRTLTLTGDMFSSIRSTIESDQNNVTIVVIKANDRFNQDKINWNSGILGLSIIGLNKGEKALITKAQKDRFNKLKKQYLS